jgi:hypothetical protein
MTSEPIAESRPFDRRKAVVSLFILWQVFTCAVQSLPSESILHETWINGIQFYITGTGGWLGSLSFFSPSPPNQVVRVEAQIRYTDGSTRIWHEPKWGPMNLWEKFVSCRAIKYFDNIYRDAERSSWPYFADYLAGRFSSADHRVKQIVLTRRWVNIPPLSPNSWQATWWPPESGNQQSYNFYTKDY